MPVTRLLPLAALAACLLFGPGTTAARAECPLLDGYLSEGAGEFAGTVGGERVQIIFTQDKRYGRPDPDLAGLVRRVGHRHRGLYSGGGSVSGDCLITLTEGDDDTGPTATWTLRFVSAERLVGHVQLKAGRRSKVRLDLVDGPGCQGREPWLTFRSPAWPIAFEYPASWLVDMSDSRRLSASLACPNLWRRAYYYSVDVIELTGDRGSGTMEMKDGRPVRSIGNFFTEDGRVWFYGHCPQGGFRGTDDCPTRQSTINGVTVLQVHSDTARNGVDMHSFLFLAPTGWVTFDTLDLNASVQGQGELVFDGQGSVLERFVRSVKLTVPTP